MASFHLILNSLNFQIRNYKVPGNIKHLINFSKVPKINFETEVRETLGRGSGPGGQNVNKANNAVTLIHLETKAFVKSHETRSVTKNREIAKEKLIDKVSEYAQACLSFRDQTRAVGTSL